MHSSCVWNTDYFVVGCCATTSLECLFFTSCIDWTSPTTDADDPLVFTWYAFSHILTATSDFFSRGFNTCYENNYPSNYRQWVRYSQLCSTLLTEPSQGCGHNATSILLTYENMPATAATISQAFIGTKELEAMATVTATASYISISTTTSTTISTASPQSPTSTGTIVGAAIGGTALLVLGAVAIAYLLLRARRANQQTTSLTNPTSPHATTSHPSAYFFDKNQAQEGMIPSSMHNSQHVSDMSQGGRGYQHQPVQQFSQADIIQQIQQPSQSPGTIEPSSPREMDGKSLRIPGYVPRKPVGGVEGLMSPSAEPSVAS